MRGNIYRYHILDLINFFESEIFKANGPTSSRQTARQIVRVDNTIRLQIDDDTNGRSASVDSSVLTATPLTTTPVDNETTSEPTISQSYSTLTSDSSLAISTSVNNQLARSLDRHSTGAIKLAAQKWFRFERGDDM